MAHKSGLKILDKDTKFTLRIKKDFGMDKKLKIIQWIRLKKKLDKLVKKRDDWLALYHQHLKK